VACFKDQIVGAVLASFDGVRGWIYHLAVHPSARRKGTATRLMRAAEEGLKAFGCPKINLQRGRTGGWRLPAQSSRPSGSFSIRRHCNATNSPLPFRTPVEYCLGTDGPSARS
jgi:GNAT superfamily N-acetyltransferase